MTPPARVHRIGTAMEDRKLYDVSLTIYPGMPVYPGNAPVEIEEVKSMERGGSSNVSLLHIGTHTSTHVDAPRHFIANGPGVDEIDPCLLVGPARLFQLPNVDHIDRTSLQALDLRGVERALFGTRNSLLLRHEDVHLDYAYVSADAASFLVDAGVRLVGVDYLSIEQYKKEGRPAHHTLLEAGIAIVEGLYLADVPPGDYELLCLPLKVKGADGAPARVLLRELK